ncbi:dihydrodipicolinate synthase family protein [Kriegella aquimaris]|uniref:Dihydrodipicolinate synthase/N-acetylneuraminate lyase n=1 Tax=Kriegella aquimaris TaxID=192904 RepID=A0A1G9VCN8_9FLAO|nr:dihydrodipicolinate synthase family protein [Kriegella aquimaris]SDM69939.1 Dihydrodipicolinate synthase/N-acetylneuraminate lyase [Kriegella aquimaris]
MVPLDHTEIFGNWATLLLATDLFGKIDYTRLSEEIDVLIDSKPSGIYSNGTAGEFYTQSDEEFYRINELLANKCEKSQTPFQIGISHPSPQLSLERLKISKTLNPGAVQVVLPDWFPPTLEESSDFLEKLAVESEKIPLVLYNPTHSKKVLVPSEWKYLKQNVPNLVGLKVFDNNRDANWYLEMIKNSNGLSVFIPGHHLATGISNGAHGAYSNMACLNPYAAQEWYGLIQTDLEAALELEVRINQFMKEAIEPFITKYHFSNPACDRFMAVVGGWADVGHKLRWPYRSIPLDLASTVREKVRNLIPEFAMGF